MAKAAAAVEPSLASGIVTRQGRDPGEAGARGRRPALLGGSRRARSRPAAAPAGRRPPGMAGVTQAETGEPERRARGPLYCPGTGRVLNGAPLIRRIVMQRWAEGSTGFANRLVLVGPSLITVLPARPTSSRRRRPLPASGRHREVTVQAVTDAAGRSEGADMPCNDASHAAVI
jgi:hypothetical protein